MTDQNITNPSTEQPAVTPAPTQAAPTSTTTEKTGGKTFTETQVEQMIRERLDREKSRREQAAAEAQKKAEEEAAAKNQEWQQLAEKREKELADLQGQLRARELADLKRSIAEKVGLPAALAARLVGESEKDLEADAKALLDTLPKPPPAPSAQKPQPGPVSPTNPGGAQQGETLAQKRARIHGSPTDAFDPQAARQHGGGAVFVGDKTGKE